jgi:uncharacterized protein
VENIKPVQVEDRINTLDILRGFAIFGIFIVNMGMINSPYIYLYAINEQMWTSTWDQIAEAFILIFAQGKFYTMFSFLFGLGFILFIERAQQKIDRPKLLFVRRLIVLFLIGVIHAYFLWYGDILMTYAVSGLLLLAFYNAKPKTLVIWAIALLSFYILLVALSVGLVSLGDAVNPGMMETELQKQTEEYKRGIESSTLAYGEGSFSDIMSQRVADLKEQIPSNIMAVFLFFPLFLLGAYAGKKKIFQNIQQNIGFIRKVWMWGFIVGLSLNLLKYWSMQQMDSLNLSIYHNYQAIGMAVGDAALCLFYISSITLLTQHQIWLKRLTPLASVGRTAISNYLFQSIICTTIFYNYGLGLYGKVGPFFGLLLTVIIFSAQLFLSRLWLQSYQFGPVEWLWRSLTYGKLQPFRK